LLKNSRGAEIFSGSNFDVQNSHNCGQSTNMDCAQNVNKGSCNAKGITLIALIITIVIMLILAGITINLTLGENGIFQKAKLAKGQYKTASIQEKLELELAAMQMGRQTDLTVEEYVDGLEEKGIVLQENIFPRETETAIKIGEKIFVVYQEGTKIEVYHEEGNVMMSDTNTWTNPDTWLNTNIDRSQIKTIQFEKTNIVPDEVVGSSNIEAEGQETGAVKCWWTEEAGGVTVGEETKTAYNITIGANGGVIAPRNCLRLFNGMGNLETISFGQIQNDIRVSNFSTENTTNMSRMFYACSKLGSLDLYEKFDTSKVTDMKYMFRRCGLLERLDLSGCNFDTKNVTNMDRMFCELSSLIYLNLGSKFNTQNVREMQVMFYGCGNLTDLQLGDNFDTGNVTDMNNMFFGCGNITHLDLGEKFNTHKVKRMDSMFRGCSKLESLDLSGCNFDTSNVTTVNRMFCTLSSLKYLNLGTKFDTGKVIDFDVVFAESFINGDSENKTTLNLGNFGKNRTQLQSDGLMFYGWSTQRVKNCNLIIENEAKTWFYEKSVTSDASWNSVNGIQY
ncbi:MAG: BspA family leucine-rich repeat surface protein, partial [Clostridia bacterium]|nr:BspA family leucine-rich repeat surface protein [Clostridia bacterium]